MKVINFLMTDSIIYYYEPLVKKRLPFIPVRKPLSLDTFFVDLNGKEVIKMKYSGYHKKKSIFDSVYYSVFSIESIKDGYPLKLYANRKFGIIAAYYNGSIAWWIE